MFGNRAILRETPTPSRRAPLERCCGLAVLATAGRAGSRTDEPSATASKTTSLFDYSYGEATIVGPDEIGREFVEF